MNDLDRSIVATLAYAGAFGWPLTIMEIWSRLIPASLLGGPVRGGTSNGVNRPSVGEIVERLEILEKIGTVVQSDGLYALHIAGAPSVVDRVRMEKECAQKWRRMRRRAWWLQAVPYVRALWASGSLALGNTGPGSDWDVMVVAKTGRLHTARLFLLAAARFMGRLRVKTDRHAPDKFCFNHYLIADGLTLRHRSLYVAQGLALMIPISDTRNFLPRLWKANAWMVDYVPLPTRSEFVRRNVGYSPTLNGIRRVLEFGLNVFPGSLLERGVRAWMQGRIEKEPATHAPGGRVIADEQEIEFHPRSFEAVALARYNTSLDRLGLGQYHQVDSGLTK